MIENFDIEEELNKLPKHPGIYIMHDKHDDILYVGKAVNLHNRVRQYFRAGHGHAGSLKIARMVEQIAYFEYIVTSSEMEALILECNLIKEHRPKYNTMLRDDKGYPYIRVTVDEEYPRVLYSHRLGRDKAKYFGPYTSAKAVHDTIDLVNKLYCLRTCSKKLPKEIGKTRPCMFYQIGQCSAPCAAMISKEDYRKSVDEAIAFLGGNQKDAVKMLKSRMQAYAEALEFEKAAQTRDLIESVAHIADRQQMSKSSGDDRDVIAFAASERDIVITVFFVREGKLIGRENHHMNAELYSGEEDVLAEFIKQFYVELTETPGEILVSAEPTDRELLEGFLSERQEKKVSIAVPQRGDKKRLLELAKENAALVLAQDMERIIRKEKRTIGAVKDIAELIGIESAARMEAYDISHISGTLSVASMVVFENGEPKKTAYRKFRLKETIGNDDYSSMKEVLSRRFTDEKLETYPDVIMMDGGRGQVNIATMVLDSLGLDIPVCGMVKDDNHHTRGLYFNNKEVEFPKNSEALLMVTALQDEAHRFAIEYHRQLRSSNQVKSVLDEIPGIGPARRKTLLKSLGSVEAISQASVEELAQIEGIPQSLAETIFAFFHK